MIRRNITYKDKSLIVPLYKAIVRPHLEYVPKSHFYELILQDRHPNTISKLSAKYQFCAIRTADTRDGKSRLSISC